MERAGRQGYLGPAGLLPLPHSSLGTWDDVGLLAACSQRQACRDGCQVTQSPWLCCAGPKKTAVTRRALPLPGR